MAEKDVTSLAWLADAPLFIDGPQVSAFYDAVVLPESEKGTVTVSTKNLTAKTTSIKGTLGIEGEVGGWITKIFPFLEVKASASGEASRTSQKSDEEGSTIVFHPISTPHRQLLHLALHYATDIPDRLLIVDTPASVDWCASAFITALPRGLVFIEFPPQTMFIPVAAEMSGGKVLLYYDRTEDDAPPYPEATSPLPVDAEALNKKRREYWLWHKEHFSALGATSQIEKAAAEQIEQHVAGSGRIRWIDYRVPIGTEGETVHLHVSGREVYDTGTFAYNLIKRGERHGLRVVGTMKSGPDMNVLAIFDK